ncbi:hypothetical protein [Zobellia nedashkovskayae]|uniref:hypothetical protein n=1 Tax=Zobellia nedashkovskayae TaxID=2779510 RepID=UPI001D03908E|nr:hypothetical protein [Zobellia nedashkovskayae]
MFLAIPGFLTINVVVCVPKYAAPFVMALNVVPLSLLSYHWLVLLLYQLQYPLLFQSMIRNISLFSPIERMPRWAQFITDLISKSTL